jgi:hypothetical protein
VEFGSLLRRVCPKLGKDEPEGRVQFNLKMCNRFRGVVTTGGKNCRLQVRIPLRRRLQHVTGDM